MMLRRPGSSRSAAEHLVKQRERTCLGQRLVAAAALRRLYARRATGRALTVRERGRPQPRRRGRESALGEAGTAVMAVVDEDGQPPGLVMLVRRHSADVPAI